MFTKLVKDCLAKHYGTQRLFISQCRYSSKMWNNNFERRNLDLKFRLSCVTNEDVQQLNEVFPAIVTDLVDTIKHTNISVIDNWYRKLLEYTVPNGKHRRAFSTILTYKLLEDPQKLTPENIRLANILGWCREMVVLTMENWRDCGVAPYKPGKDSRISKEMLRLKVTSAESWGACSVGTYIPEAVLATKQNNEPKVDGEIIRLNVTSSENWDECNVGTYIPETVVASKPLLLKPPAGANKRQFYLRERERHAALSKKKKNPKSEVK